MASAGWMGLARATNNLPELTTRLYGIKTNADLERSRQGLTARGLDIQQQLGERSAATAERGAATAERGVAVSERNAAVNEGQLALERQKLERSTTLAQKPYSPGEIGMLKAGLISIDKENGTSLQKTSTQFLNNIQERSKLGHTKADIYVDMKANYGTYIKPVMEGLQADLERAAGSGDMQKAQQIAKVMDGMSKPEFLDAIMPNAARYVNNQQAMIDAEIAQKTKPPAFSTTEAGVTAANQAKIKAAEIAAGGRVNAANIAAENKTAVIPAGSTLVNTSSGKTVATGTDKLPKDMTTEARMTSKDVAEAEEKILSNPDNQATQGKVDLFNQYSTKPYMYELETTEGKIYGTNTKTKKIALPKINGKQVTAADVYNTAQQNGVTIQEVLNRIGVK